MVPEVLVVEGGDLELLLLPALDPCLALTLRVDQEWVAGRLGDDDAVLDGEVVVGQTLKGPLPDGGTVHKQGGDVEVACEGDPVPLELPLPPLHQMDPKLLVEGSRVGEEGRSQQGIPHQLPNLLLELLALLGPPLLLSAQAGDERGGGLHLLAAGLGRVQQGLLLPHCSLVHHLHGVQLPLLVVQLGLGHLQAAHGHLEPPLLDGQVGLEGEDLLVDGEEEGHGRGPGAEARHVPAHLLGRLKVVVLHGEVRGQELHRLLVDGVLAEVLQRLEEALLAHHLRTSRGD